MWNSKLHTAKKWAVTDKRPYPPPTQKQSLPDTSKHLILQEKRNMNNSFATRFNVTDLSASNLESIDVRSETTGTKSPWQVSLAQEPFPPTSTPNSEAQLQTENIFSADRSLPLFSVCATKMNTFASILSGFHHNSKIWKILLDAQGDLCHPNAKFWYLTNEWTVFSKIWLPSFSILVHFCQKVSFRLIKTG